VAVGDVNGDGFPDVITAPGPGGGSEIKAFDGRTGAPLRDFFAFGPGLTTGFFVASGDVNKDKVDDIIVAPDAGGPPEVRVFEGTTAAMLFDFFAYPGFSGGVRVASGDVNGDGYADIITGAGPGGAPEVKVFSGTNGGLLMDFLAFTPAFSGGVFVAASDVNGDGRADIIVGVGAGSSPQVNVFNGASGALLYIFTPYYPGFIDGIHVGGVHDLNSDALSDILTAGGYPGASGLTEQDPLRTPAGTVGAIPVQALDGLSLATLDSFYAYAPYYFGGVWVAGSR
jgi:hypothetical protein